MPLVSSEVYYFYLGTYSTRKPTLLVRDRAIFTNTKLRAKRSTPYTFDFFPENYLKSKIIKIRQHPIRLYRLKTKIKKMFFLKSVKSRKRDKFFPFPRARNLLHVSNLAFIFFIHYSTLCVRWLENFKNIASTGERATVYYIKKHEKNVFIN